MSAMMSSDRLINTLASFAKQNDVYYTHRGVLHRSAEGENAAHIAKVLYLTNEGSMTARYGDRVDVTGVPPEFVEVKKGLMPPPIVIIKSCQFIGYQCDEVDDYAETECYAILAAIISKAAMQLPGWDGAPWGI